MDLIIRLHTDNHWIRPNPGVRETTSTIGQWGTNTIQLIVFPETSTLSLMISRLKFYSFNRTDLFHSSHISVSENFNLFLLSVQSLYTTLFPNLLPRYLFAYVHWRCVILSGSRLSFLYPWSQDIDVPWLKTNVGITRSFTFI